MAHYTCSSCGTEGAAPCKCDPLDRALEALKANPNRSNREIAADIGVSDMTVGKARKSNANLFAVEKTIGRDGRVRQAIRSGIDKPKPASQDIIELEKLENASKYRFENQDVTYKDVANKFGVSPRNLEKAINSIRGGSFDAVKSGDKTLDRANEEYAEARRSWDIPNTISVPERAAGETADQIVARHLLTFLSDDLDICNKIMCDFRIDNVDDEVRAKELLDGCDYVIAAWQKIRARAASNPKLKGLNK